MSLACETTIAAGPDPSVFILGTRDVATPLRVQVEAALEHGMGSVCVDFGGLLVSQSFMDEFLGVMILRHGPSILERVVFRNCNDDVKAAVELVASVRGADYGKARAALSS
ncbi:STAS-like domain-containing protein [Steroidobacter cummioxidans]|uniref:STAS-like domain-containing protein n=1 Tax=Steroidobacter cummioxidans TaxID=1803913 RepID=UPI000E30EDE4|nr:DUF4325 domain-containing protein [Steroidobacter cummioxidans]